MLDQQIYTINHKYKVFIGFVYKNQFYLGQATEPFSSVFMCTQVSSFSNRFFTFGLHCFWYARCLYVCVFPCVCCTLHNKEFSIQFKLRFDPSQILIVQGLQRKYSKSTLTFRWKCQFWSRPTYPEFKKEVYRKYLYDRSKLKCQNHGTPFD